MRVAIALIVCLLGAQGTAEEPQPAGTGTRDDTGAAVSVLVTPQEVRLAETVKLTIQVRDPRGLGYELPEKLDLSPFVELNRSRDTEPIEGQATTVLRLEIATYEQTGEVKTPAFNLVIRSKGEEQESDLEVPSIVIQVKSVLDGVEKPEPRDVAQPVSITVRDYRPLVYLGLTMAWLSLALLLRLRGSGMRATERLEDLPPSRPAHEIAFERLRSVVEDDLLRKGRIQEYFVRISETVREYLGNRYGFFALDLTSRELLEELRDRPTPGLEHALLQRLLQEADLVKFARLQPTDEMASRSIDGAFSLVASTKLVEVSGEGAEEDVK